jgi:hypothetical protein
MPQITSAEVTNPNGDPIRFKVLGSGLDEISSLYVKFQFKFADGQTEQVLPSLKADFKVVSASELSASIGRSVAKAYVSNWDQRKTQAARTCFGKLRLGGLLAPPQVMGHVIGLGDLSVTVDTTDTSGPGKTTLNPYPPPA